MTIKERIENLLLKFEAPVVAPVALGEYTTVDGTVIKCAGELAQGVAVTVMSEAGEGPAPDGVYELTDGKVITVAAGTVSTIEEKAPEPTAEYALKADFDAAQAASNEKIAALEAIIAGFTQKFEALTGQQKETLTLMQEFAALEPEPEKKPNNTKPDHKSERLTSLTKAIQNLNK